MGLKLSDFIDFNDEEKMSEMAKDFATIISDINNQEEEAIRETDGNDFKE